MVGLIRTYEKNFLLVLGIGVAVLVLAFSCSAGSFGSRCGGISKSTANC